MAIGTKGIRRIALYGTALLVAAALILPFALTPLINSTAVKERITHEIHRHTGIRIPPENLDLVLAPFPGIRVRDLALPLGQGVTAAVETISLDLDLTRLLDRKISLDRILIQNPAVRFAKGIPSLPAGGNPSFSTEIPRDLVGKLYGFLPDSQGDLIVDVDGLKTDYFSTMDLQLLVFKNQKKILFQLTVHDLDLNQSRLAGLGVPESLSLDQVLASKLHLTLRLDHQGRLNGKLAVTSPRVETRRLAVPLSAPALSFDVHLSSEKRSARLLPSELTYPGGQVGVEFSEDRRNGNISLIFSGKKVDITQAREVCLPLLKGIEVSDQLFDILRGGTARVVTVGFGSRSYDTLFDVQNLVIRGEAADARVKIPATPLVAEQVGARASMKTGVLHIEPSRGTVAGTTIRSGVLDIDLDHDTDVPFSGSFSLDARLDSLPATLISLLPESRLAREMERVSQVSGTTKAQLNLSMAPGQEDLSVVVRAREIKAAGRYAPIPLPLEIHTGNFTLENGKVLLTEVSGTLGKSPVSHLTASVTIDDRQHLELTRASGNFNLEELMPWAASQPSVMALISPAQKVTGTLVLDQITISGPMFIPDKWVFSAQGSGEDLTIGLADHPRSFESVSGKFHLTQDRIRTSGIRARTRDLGWLGFAFDKETLASIRLPLHLSQGRVDISDQTFVHGTVASPGGPSASFDLAGRDMAHLTPTLMTLKDEGVTDVLVIPYTDPDKPKYSFDGRLDTRSVDKLLVRHSFLQEALVRLTGPTPLTIYTDSQSNLYLETRKLDLDVLLGRDKKTPVSKAEKTARDNRPLLAQKSLNFRADSLVYLNRTFSDVLALVTFDPQKTQVDIRQIGLCRLKGTGRVDITHGRSEPDVITQFSLNVLNETNIADVFSCMFKAESVINGAYSFSMDLDGTGTPDTVTRKQQGKLTFRAEQGRIYKATILSRVLSVINILDVDLRQKGFAYKTFTVDADIVDSVVRLKKVYIDAENMAVIASGWLDPLNDKMDVTFLVAPFKTIDTLIKKIPVINTLLSGRLISLPARASGPISDPSVVPLDPTAVGKGLFNMLKDLVKTPVRLFQDEKTP